jgi:hypothetical protein
VHQNNCTFMAEKGPQQIEKKSDKTLDEKKV